MIEDISFKNYKKKDDIHGTVLYPAVMVAPIQNAIMSDLIANENIQSVFDPFHGSGTALYECAEISSTIKLVGCDINPLANLITKVKLQGIGENFEEDFYQLQQTITNMEGCESYSFPNIDKWFREDISDELRILRSSIQTIENKQNRLFFWYMLCDIVRKFSNTRSSTYKLHKREDDAIQRIESKVIAEYITATRKTWIKFRHRDLNFDLYKCNILEKMSQFADNSFDITITSPPYGDNSTTVPYGQFSMLAMYWIDKKDLEIEGWEYDSYSIIDSKSIGGCYSKTLISENERALIQPYLDKIIERKQDKVIRFFADYFKVMRDFCRVTTKYLVLTLGNRTVDGVKINLTDITRKFIEQNTFIHLQTYEREIPSKRTPKKTSRVNNKPVDSMNSEFVSIYKRNK